MRYDNITPEISAALECAKNQYLATKPDNKGPQSYRANPKQTEELFIAMKLAGATPNDSNNVHLNNGDLDLTIIGPSSSKERYARVYFNLRYLQGLVTGMSAGGTMPHSPLTTFLESIDIMLGLTEFDKEAVKQMKMEKISNAVELMQMRQSEWQELLYGANTPDQQVEDDKIRIG